TVICFLVQVYSLGYMAGDPGFSRYFAVMSLFAWAMTSMTLAPSLFQLYIFWELVGLASYLLIGFWYEKFSASTAGKKAFVMTRVGDVAFFLGMLIVLIHLGDLNIQEINGSQTAARMSPTLITTAALLIFGGVVGKSAQFPLLTWLPDAMEGPTPVSALLHSATMVAAGVYLFARLFPFFSLSPTAMSVCLTVGTASMLLASTMALVSRDIKQVWAYSTISQLGYMIMGLAAGGYFAGLFHLTTHAMFKALLFLCSGVFIHAWGSNDMFDIGRRGGRGMKTVMGCLVLAAAALAGLPPLAGLFSKELILAGLAERSNPFWLAAGLLGVFLTAYYAFRLVFVILCPRTLPSSPDAPPGPAADGGHGPDASPHHGRVMVGPLVVLAVITLLLGFCQGPLERFLQGPPIAGHGANGGVHGWLTYLALALAGGGMALAWLEFGRPGAGQVGFVERVPWLKTLFAERWYLDRLYRLLLDRVVYRGVSRLLTQNDRQVIDGGLHALSRATVKGGRGLNFLHAGMVQYKLLVMFAVVVLLALYLIF
ncbi:MAG: NADH-quinone oxidoreductase subunit L, partial [Desulfobacterales bacterium]|nr:NADH-quinone oxidoreductase subunit L [Desulfobacterales bacterium]